jgi:hypothetical protein
MDQKKCINDVINRYKDFPTIQSDIRKVIRYQESFFRMWSTGIVKEEADNGCSVAPHDATPAELRYAFRHYPAAVRASVEEAATRIIEDSAQSALDSLRNLKEAQETGVSDAEFLRLIVDQYAAPVISDHPGIDTDQLRADLMTVARIALDTTTTHIRGVVDRLIEREAANV